MDKRNLGCYKLIFKRKLLHFGFFVLHRMCNTFKNNLFLIRSILNALVIKKILINSTLDYKKLRQFSII